MAHGAKDDPRCPGTWRVSGNPCRHVPRPGHDTCAAHDPEGDQRPEPLPDAIRCTGTTKETGERCRLSRPPTGTVCYRHGGLAPQVRKATRIRESDRKARAMVETYGLPIEISPEQAILAEVHRTAGHVAWLEQQVRELSPDELVYRGSTEEAVPHAYLRLYQHERAHLAKVCADAIRIGIEARQVRLAEEQGAMVAKAMRAILADLHLTAAQKALVATVVPKHLRELALTN
jgi:hypothetical protein